MADDIHVIVRVKPGSRKGPLVVQGEPVPGDSGTREREALTVFLQERAVDGRANDALVKVLAKHYGVARSAVSIVRGHAARVKQVRIVS